MTTALFVIGAPGVGKTTAIRHLVGEGIRELELIAKPKWSLCRDRRTGLGTIALAGHYTGQTFDGGDTVPYTGAREALEYWAANLLGFDLTIFDGDRFSTQPSLDFVRTHAAKVLGAFFVAPQSELAVRRAARASNQNETWMKGRETKAINFASKVGAKGFDARLPAPRIALDVALWLDEQLPEVA